MYLCKYYPYGYCRNSQGDLGTDKRFTGQRLDSTGLYYYNARYYDTEIGRFISPDTIIPNPANPQSLNRYSYCLNNPLKYVDPSGYTVVFSSGEAGVSVQQLDDDFMYWDAFAYIGQQEAAEIVELYNAYSYFRTMSDETGLAAATMEYATDYYVNIVTDENAKKYGNIITEGDDYTLLIHPEAFTYNRPDDIWTPASVIWDLVGAEILQIHPENNLANAYFPNPVEAIANITGFSGALKVLSVFDTLFYGRYEELISLPGDIPGIGWVYKGTYELIVQQDKYFEQCLEQGYYPRKQ